MEAQTPAEGILLRKSYGDAKSYVVECECGCGEHAHHVWVEADESGVTVQTFVELKTDWWSENVEKRYDIDNNLAQWYDWFWKDIWNGLVTRLRLTRDIWFHGYVKYEATLIMNQQQTLNYAETLKSAMADVEEFRKNNVRNK
jgi:hypothetical protein